MVSFMQRAQNESFSTTGIQERQHWWMKCVYRRGDYVENTYVYI